MWKTQLKTAERRDMFILITVSQVMRVSADGHLLHDSGNVLVSTLDLQIHSSTPTGHRSGAVVMLYPC